MLEVLVVSFKKLSAWLVARAPDGVQQNYSDDQLPTPLHEAKSQIGNGNTLVLL